ncbi:MAG: hypothetical protein AAGC81_07505 [Pseudomonadota bacterium]
MDDETVQILARSANLAGQSGMLKEATTIIDALNVALPGDENVDLLRASTMLHTGKFGDAEKILRDTILSADSGNSSATFLLGMAYHLSGKNSDRDRTFQQYLDMTASDTEAEADGRTVAEGLMHS